MPFLFSKSCTVCSRIVVANFGGVHSFSLHASKFHKKLRTQYKSWRRCSCWMQLCRTVRNNQCYSQPQSKLPLQPGTVHKKPLMRLKTDVSRENARTTTNLCGIAKPKDKERMCKKFTQAQSKFFLFPPASLPCSFFFPSVHFLLEPNSQTVSEAFYNFHRFIWCKVAK